MLASLWWGDVVATFKVQLSCQLHFDGGMLRLSKFIFHDAVWNLSNICIHDSSADASIDSSWLYSEQSSTVYQESSSILSSYSCMFSQCVLSQSNCSHRATCLSSICLWSSKKNNKQYRTQFTYYSPSSRTGQTLLVLRLIMFYMMVHDSILLWLSFGFSSICTCISQTALFSVWRLQALLLKNTFHS